MNKYIFRSIFYATVILLYYVLFTDEWEKPELSPILLGVLFIAIVVLYNAVNGKTNEEIYELFGIRKKSGKSKK